VAVTVRRKGKEAKLKVSTGRGDYPKRSNPWTKAHESGSIHVKGPKGEQALWYELGTWAFCRCLEGLGR